MVHRLLEVKGSSLKMSSCSQESQSVDLQLLTNLLSELQGSDDVEQASMPCGITPTCTDLPQPLLDLFASHGCMDSQELLTTHSEQFVPLDSQEWRRESAALNSQIFVTQFHTGQSGISQHTVQNQFSNNEVYCDPPNHVDPSSNSHQMAQSSTPQHMAQSSTPQHMAQSSTPQYIPQVAQFSTEQMAQFSTLQYILQSSTLQQCAQSSTLQQCAQPSILQQCAQPSTLQQCAHLNTHCSPPHQIAHCDAVQKLVQQSIPQDAQSFTQQKMGCCSPLQVAELSSPPQMTRVSTPELEAQSRIQQEVQPSTRSVNMSSMKQKSITTAGTSKIKEPIGPQNKKNEPQTKQKDTKKKSSANARPTKPKRTADPLSLEPKVKRPKKVSTAVPAHQCSNKRPCELDNPLENELKLQVYYQSSEVLCCANMSNCDGYLMYHQRPWHFQQSRVNVTNIEFPELSKGYMTAKQTAASKEILTALAKGIHIFCDTSGDIYAHRFCKSRVFCYSTVCDEGFQGVVNTADQPMREPSHKRYVQILPIDKAVKVFNKRLFDGELLRATQTNVLPKVPTVYLTFSQSWEAGFPISNCLVYVIVKPQYARYQRKCLNQGNEESFECNETNLATSLATLSLNQS